MGKFDKYREFEIEGNRIMKYFGNGGEVVIPEGITDIFFEVFECNSQITSVSIPSTLTDISLFTFAHCSSLERAILCEGVSRIEAFAFAHCSLLHDVYLPRSVVFIGAGAFLECKELTIHYAGSEDEWSKIEIDTPLSASITICFNS